MKHSIEITSQRKEIIEVEFPSFFKNNWNRYLGLINEETIYTVFHNEELTTINSGNADNMKDVLADSLTATQVTEEDFFAAYKLARKATELNPVIEYYAGAEGIVTTSTLK